MDPSPRFEYTLPDGKVCSTVDRQVRGKQRYVTFLYIFVEAPEARRFFLDDQVLFQSDEDGKKTVNLKELRQHFFEEGKLTESQVYQILELGSAVLRPEPNLVEVDAPIVGTKLRGRLFTDIFIVVGDIHGQYYDLMKVFEVAGGEPPANRFIFLGDYVDRGYFSFESFLYLLAMKACYPDLIYLLRGNHESRNLTRHFTFKLECTYKYGEAVYTAVMEAFDCLPLAGLVNKQFFCAHGGISPAMNSPQDLNTLNRFQDPPKSGLGCDVLWSDPTENFGDEKHNEEFVANGARGCSYRYSYQGACKFLKRNNLLSIVRGHEAQAAGYRLYKNATDSEFPALMTIFSAANYVDVYKNKGAILKYDGKVLNIRQYEAVPHPYYLPKFMNAFDWSLPFVAEKTAEFFMAILNMASKDAKIEGLTDEERAKLDKDFEDRQRLIKSKIKAMARVNKMFQTIRNERETLTELMNVMGTKSLPSQYLILSHEDLRSAIDTFEHAKQADAINELNPPDDENKDTASVYSMSMEE